MGVFEERHAQEDVVAALVVRQDEEMAGDLPSSQTDLGLRFPSERTGTVEPFGYQLGLLDRQAVLARSPHREAVALRTTVE